MSEYIVKNLDNEQLQIIQLVKKGFTNIEIGVELGYSSESIKKRLSKIYKKFGVAKRIELLNILSC